MVRLDSAALERNSKHFVGVAEGVCAIPLNKNESIKCQHAHDRNSLKNPFLIIRRCKTAITDSSINVNLDHTNAAWSPNLHLRLLQLWLESADFRAIVTERKIVSVIDGKTEQDKTTFYFYREVIQNFIFSIFR